MTPEERKNLVRRMFDEVWNKGNVDFLDEVCAPHCSFHNPSFPIDGVAGAKQQARELREAQPDLHVDVHDVLCDGDYTASRWTMGGTARGEFRGLPGTGKSYVMTGMGFAKWESDRIVETWGNSDVLGALQQVGIIPELAPAAPSETT